ncbi:MAG: hypothetical protein EA377_08795, partial [Phycisphaerales bacterium]
MRWTTITLIAAGICIVTAIGAQVVWALTGLRIAMLGALTGTFWILMALMLHWHVTFRMIELHVLRPFNRVNLVLTGITALLWISVLWLSAEVMPARGAVILTAAPLTVIGSWFLLCNVFFMLKLRHAVLAGLR